MPDSPPSLAKQLIGTKFTTVVFISTYPEGHIMLSDLLTAVAVAVLKELADQLGKKH